MFMTACSPAEQRKANAPQTPVSKTSKTYEAKWSSLRQHQHPQWLVDGKFGIYCHWGLSTINYGKGHMFSKHRDIDSLIDEFTAQNFDAARWAQLFKKAGAKFAGPIGWHGSKYLHWDSELTEYNSVDKKPHIDIVGELQKAIRKEGLKFFVSLHHQFYQEGWINYGKEVVDKYHPDVFWVDAGFGNTKGLMHNKVMSRSKFIGQGKPNRQSLGDKKQREFLSYFFNAAQQQQQEVDFIYKSYDIPPGIGMHDLENGLLDHIAYDVWMTDMDMNICPDWKTHGWFYREGIPLRDANNIVDLLVDVVSKNGVLALNVPPLADGTFTPEIEQTLSEVGEWLGVNGEAIYGSTPWITFGEGPVDIKPGNYTFHHNEHFGE